MSIQIEQAPWADELPPPDDPPPGDEPLGRALPHDPEAEAACLGAVMLSAQALEDATAVVRPGDFYRPEHETIAGAAFAMHAAGRPVDAVTVAAELTASGDLNRVGGPAYLHTLITATPTAASAGYYAGLVRDRARARALVMAGRRIEQLGYSPDVDDATAQAEAELEAVTSTATAAATAAPAGEGLDDLIDALADPIDPVTSGLLWGYTDLDMVLLPMLPGQLLVVGARPSVGKTSFALDVARRVAVHARRTVVFGSLEQSRAELQLKLLSAEARVPLARLRAHTLTGEDWDRIAQAHVRLTDAPLIIDENPHIGITEIRAAIRQHHPDLYVLDYLQLARMAGSGRSTESRRDAVETFTRELKLTAKAHALPILVAAQLNRGPEQRSDKRPQMSDLRESGSVENDADVVLLLHRPDMHERESPRAGEADVIIAKQRGGPTDTVPLGAQLHYSRFADMGAWQR